MTLTLLGMRETWWFGSKNLLLFSHVCLLFYFGFLLLDVNILSSHISLWIQNLLMMIIVQLCYLLSNLSF